MTSYKRIWFPIAASFILAAIIIAIAAAANYPKPDYDNFSGWKIEYGKGEGNAAVSEAAGAGNGEAPSKLIGSIDTGRRLTKGNIDSVAKGFMERNRAFLKISPEDMQLKRAEQDSPVYSQQSGIWYATYEQTYEGVPVENGYMVMVYVDDKLVVVNSNYMGGIDVDTEPEISSDDAVQEVKAATAAITATTAAAGIELRPKNVALVVYNSEGNYYLAWKVELPLNRELQGAWIYYVDAHTGRIISRYNNVIFEDAYGRVTGMIYQEHWKQNRTLVNMSNNTVTVYQQLNNSVFFSGRANSLVNAMGTARAVNLTGYTDVNLTLRARYEHENTFDYTYVRVSANGTTWQTLESLTGKQTNWTTKNYSLNNYINSSVYINFTTTQDTIVMDDGFFADNITIVTNSGVIFSEDANTSSNWTLSGYALKNDSFVNSTFTNQTGHYNVSGFSGNVTLITYMKSPWFRVTNTAPASYETNHTAAINTSSNGSHSWNWNASDDSYSLEATTTLYHGVRVHDYFTNGTPFNVTDMNYEMILGIQDTSLAANCNAFYSAPNIFFTPAGGGCNATSLLSDVVYHEYTHAVVDKIYVPSMSSGQPGAMNEGFADYFAATLNNNPCLAEEWTATTPCLRNLNNTDKKPTSFTEVHADSTPFSGAMWDLRIRVGNTKADNLIIRAMKVQSQTFNSFLDDLLVMDDNNTNLSDGTPNRGAICYSFSALHSINTSLCNNSAPGITAFGPSTANFSIREPNNQTFIINYSDAHNDVVTIAWFVNGTNHTGWFNSTTFNFTGGSNYSGSYNVTVFVYDWNSSSSTEWRFGINETDTAPYWNYTLQNQTMQEDTSLVFNVSASDYENDVIRYFSNDTRLNVSGATFNPGLNATINFTPATNFNGTIYLNITASDGTLNVSEILFVNVTPVNDAPVITQQASITINETDWINITINAIDIDSDFFNYSINYSRFTQNTSGNFSWRTNTTSAGSYVFMANATDGSATGNMSFNVTIIDQIDSDLDGTPDIYDSDDDNDGIPDTTDYLLGTNASFINATENINSTLINITVNGSSNLSQSFNGTFLVNISNGSISIMEFYWNFTNATLYLNFTIDVQPPNSTYGAVLVKGLVLEQNRTKNVSMLAVNNTISTVCVKDADVAGISNISSSCNSLNETLISCPGSNGSYSCSLVNNTLNNTYYKMSGLRFSAAKQQCPDSDSDGYYANGCGNGSDCDDIRANVYSGAPEVCNDNLDNNCNGQTDEGCGGGSSSGGGGGGGGGSSSGGGGGVTPNPARATYIFTQVAAGSANTMKISSPSIALTRISFTTSADYKALSIYVEPLNTTAAAQYDLDNVYQYIKVQPSTAISDSGISYALIDFKVNKSWIADNGYDKTLVRLKRLKEGVWNELPITPLNETELAYSYSAESPGFSVFSITAKKTKPDDKPAADKTNKTNTGKTGTAAINTTTPAITASTIASTTKEAAVRMPEKGFMSIDLGMILVATLIGILLAAAAIAYVSYSLRKRKRKL